MSDMMLGGIVHLTKPPASANVTQCFSVVVKRRAIKLPGKQCISHIYKMLGKFNVKTTYQIMLLLSMSCTLHVRSLSS